MRARVGARSKEHPDHGGEWALLETGREIGALWEGGRKKREKGAKEESRSDTCAQDCSDLTDWQAITLDINVCVCM